jgi:undecaprenyl-diphosphatase
MKLWNSADRNLLVVTGVLSVLAIAMSIGAHWLSRFPGDLNLTLLFQLIHSNTLLFVMKAVSIIGSGWPSALLVIIGSIVVWWRLGKWDALLTIAAGLSSLLVSIIKFLVGRPRPTPDLVEVLVVEHNKSFPSGHALFSMVFLGLMAYFVFTYMHRQGFRMLIFVSLIIIIVLIGASRVYLGVHWSSDVLGGYLVGSVFLGIFIWLDRIFKLQPKSG